MCVFLSKCSMLVLAFIWVGSMSPFLVLQLNVRLWSPVTRLWGVAATSRWRPPWMPLSRVAPPYTTFLFLRGQRNSAWWERWTSPWRRWEVKLFWELFTSQYKSYIWCVFQVMCRQSAVCAAEPLDSEDLLFLLYTSGSTGKPKGIVHTQAGYLLYTSLTHQVHTHTQTNTNFLLWFKWGWEDKGEQQHCCLFPEGWRGRGPEAKSGPKSFKLAFLQFYKQ